MIDGIIAKLDVMKALKEMEDRGEVKDILLGILLMGGIVISAFVNVIAFVKFEASPEFLRFLIIANMAWIFPTYLTNNRTEKAAALNATKPKKKKKEEV